jgi:hypothetical protein
MLYFKSGMGSLEVQVDNRTLGYIDKGGFFTGPTHIRDHMKVSPADLRRIADKAEESIRRGKEGLFLLPS